MKNIYIYLLLPYHQLQLLQWYTVCNGHMCFLHCTHVILDFLLEARGHRLHLFLFLVSSVSTPGISGSTPNTDPIKNLTSLGIVFSVNLEKAHFFTRLSTTCMPNSLLDILLPPCVCTWNAKYIWITWK